MACWQDGTFETQGKVKTRDKWDDNLYLAHALCTFLPLHTLWLAQTRLMKTNRRKRENWSRMNI